MKFPKGYLENYKRENYQSSNDWQNLSELLKNSQFYKHKSNQDKWICDLTYNNKNERKQKPKRTSYKQKPKEREYFKNNSY